MTNTHASHASHEPSSPTPKPSPTPTRPPRGPRALLIGALLVATTIVLVLAWPNAGDIDGRANIDDLALGETPSVSMSLSSVDPPNDAPPTPPAIGETTPLVPPPAGLEALLAASDSHRLIVTLQTPCQVVVRPEASLRRVAGKGVLRARLQPLLVWKGIDDGDYRLGIDDPAWSLDPIALSLHGTPSERRLTLLPEPRDRISGTISVGADRHPVRAARVVLETDVADCRPSCQLALDEHGAFDVGGWDLPDDVRRVRFVASVAGHVDAESDWVSVPDPHVFAIAGLDLVLTGKAILRGRVTDASGRGVRVKAQLEPAPSGGRVVAFGETPLAPDPVRVVSDDDGRYELATRAPAECVLVVSDVGGDSAWWSEVLRLAPDEERVLDVVVPSPASLEGRITSGPGVAAQPRTLVLVPLVPQPGREFRSRDVIGEPVRGRFRSEGAKIAADGSYAFHDVPAGSYVLEVRGDRGSQDTLGSPLLDALRIALPGGVTTQLDIALAPPTWVAGTVVAPDVADLSDLVAMALDAEGRAGPAVPVGPDGRFDLPIPWEGDVVCAVFGPNYHPSRVLALRPVHLSDGGGVTALRLDATRTTLSIAGRGSSQSRFELIALPRDGALAHALHSVQESFRSLTFAGLPAGSYELAWRDGTDGEVSTKVLELHEDEPLRVEVP